MTRDTRRALGTFGEDVAVRHLRAAGYELVDRNFRTRYGEIDIVAADRRHIVFCEVKTRVAGGTGGPAAPLDAIGSVKRTRLRRLAREWLRTRPADPGRPVRSELRFDAIGVVVTPRGELVRLDHVEGAF
jgi:putative endonuclease